MIDYTQYFNLVECSHYTDGTGCIASNTACPRVGIIVLDRERKSVSFLSNSITEILKNTPLKPYDYEVMSDHFLSGIGEKESADKGGCISKTLQMSNKHFCYTIYHINRESVLVFLRDITEKMMLESIAEAVNTMENTGYIFSGIRHEIGNPINSIKMTLSVLKKNLETFPQATVLEYIDRALMETARIEYLLKTLKNFNMFENPVIQRVNLPSFINSLLSLAVKDFEENGINIKTLISPEVKYIRTDQRALQQVMLNVITNASDALKEAKDPEITISAENTGTDYVSITIKDNGCGMGDTEKGNLFKPFYTSKPNGTGLGLVITKNLLTKMQGSIEIESAEKEGTSVKIDILREKRLERKEP
ncbi:MAG: HAMP domain-containing histidine kinase [Deltaproteobacteria bacterium]|nr:HAMP domain-containing histidine kinase [Deltaproteobacteria bacterium]